MRVLIACEYSARVRDAFRARGHDAVSCDLSPSEGDPRYHVTGDVLPLLSAGWDALIAFPPCTYLTRANAWRWNAIAREREDALSFVRTLMNAPVPRITIENPAGAIGTEIRPADQYVQPWHYGEPWQKTTGLWLKGFPLLVPDVDERPAGVRAYIDNRPRTRGSLSGAGGVRRSVDRSRTFAGIAEAMADQWGRPRADRYPVRPVLYRGSPASQVSGWQAHPSGDPGRSVATVRTGGRTLTAYAREVTEAPSWAP